MLCPIWRCERLCELAECLLLYGVVAHPRRPSPSLAGGGDSACVESSRVLLAKTRGLHGGEDTDEHKAKCCVPDPPLESSPPNPTWWQQKEEFQGGACVHASGAYVSVRPRCPRGEFQLLVMFRTQGAFPHESQGDLRQEPRMESLLHARSQCWEEGGGKEGTVKKHEGTPLRETYQESTPPSHRLPGLQLWPCGHGSSHVPRVTCPPPPATGRPLPHSESHHETLGAHCEPASSTGDSGLMARALRTLHCDERTLMTFLIV